MSLYKVIDAHTGEIVLVDRSGPRSALNAVLEGRFTVSLVESTVEAAKLSKRARLIADGDEDVQQHIAAISLPQTNEQIRVLMDAMLHASPTAVQLTARDWDGSLSSTVVKIEGTNEEGETASVATTSGVEASEAAALTSGEWDSAIEAAELHSQMLAGDPGVVSRETGDLPSTKLGDAA
jgi:hypothetical protein